MNSETSGSWLRNRIRQPRLLIAPGAYDAFSAKVVEAAGAEVVYCGGYATTASAYGLPDIGLMGMSEMLAVYERIVSVVSVPVFVDVDTGYGGPLNVQRCISSVKSLGIAGVHIEDQVDPKRCGHVSGKKVLSISAAHDRVAAAAQAAGPDGPAIVARTDALAVEGLDSVIDRSAEFEKAGAHAFFVDAVTSLEEIRTIREHCNLPMLFNTAPTGVSPVLTPEECTRLGFSIMIFPVQLLMSAMASCQAAAKAIIGGSTVAPEVTFKQLNSVTRLDEYIDADLRWRS